MHIENIAHETYVKRVAAKILSATLFLSFCLLILCNKLVLVVPPSRNSIGLVLKQTKMLHLIFRKHLFVLIFVFISILYSIPN